MTIRSLAFVLVATVAFTANAQTARDQIRAVGSSTVYPFSAAVAEHFGAGGTFKTPIVESTGTGGGIKLFCQGVGGDAPDIANASRKITDTELATCKAAGVTAITEVPIGYDGIVIANSAAAPKFNITKQQIFMALGKQVPKDGKLIDNPYTNWKEIDPALSDEAIEVYGPPPTSGTRDAFVELVMEKACKAMPEFEAAFTDEKDRKKHCGLLREDGKFVEASENDNIIVQKLTSNPKALGIFGYSFLEENSTAVQGSTVEGVAPTFENILGGQYTVSRLLYVYIKNQHLDVVPGIREFMAEFTGEAAFGPEGYLAQAGLIPLPEADRAASRDTVKTMKSLTF